MTASGAGRLELTGWLFGHTRSLLAPLAASTVLRVGGQLLGIWLLVEAVRAVLAPALGQAVDPWALAGTLVALSLAKALARYLEHYLGHWVAFSALERLRVLFFSSLVPQAPDAIRGRAGAELTDQATADIDRIEVFFAHTFPPAVSAVMTPAVALGWLAGQDPRMALTLLPFVLCCLGLPFFSAGTTWRASAEAARRRGEVAVQVGDDIQGAGQIIAFEAEARRLDRLGEVESGLRGARRRVGLVQAWRNGLIVVIQGCGLVALLGTGGEQHQVAVALAVGIGLWGPTRSIDDFASGLDASFAAAGRVRRVIDGVPLVSDPESPQEFPATAPAVRLEGVGLTYPGRVQPALTEVSAVFEAGRWSCVVGVSGSGKSTLVSLLLRDVDPDSGRVSFDDIGAAEVELTRLRRQVAVVSQRPTLLSDSIAGNLRLAARDAAGEELERALDLVGLAEWVRSLPDGLDTVLKERGVSVSGGQLQRLALARALVAGPLVLVLDEALSQLDAGTAVELRGRLESLPNLTVIEITHRLDQIADLVPTVVLDEGRVIEHAPAGELRAARGAFARLEARYS